MAPAGESEHVPVGVTDEHSVPQALGEFEIDGVLGKGGSGIVYAAQRRGRPVALKVLRPEEIPTGKERRRFLAEAQNMARIDHPGVVRVLDVGELSDGRPYLAMELLDGVNLGTRLRQGPLPLDTALALFAQLADAVGVLHDAGLIHRDLKPENVMLVDGGERVVLLDFGIARIADAPPSTTTEAGLQRGTPAFMAPERFFGARATRASDVYELGLILYIMITGALPWKDALNAKERLEPKRPFVPGGDELPTGIEAAIMFALAADVDERPVSVHALANEVRRASGGVPLWMASRGSEGTTAQAVPNARSSREVPGTEAAPSARYAAEPSRRRVVVPAVIGLAVLLGAGGVWIGTRGSGGDKVPVAVPGPGADSSLDAGAGAGPVPPVGGPGAGPGAVPPVGGPGAGPVPDASVPPPRKPPTRTKRVATRRKSQARRRAASPAKPSPAKPAAAKPGTISKTTAGAPLPSCRKVLTVLCGAKFKGTEGSFRGAQCRNMGKQFRNWEASPPSVRPTHEKWCKNYYPVIVKVLQERLRYIKKHGGPPGPGGPKK